MPETYQLLATASGTELRYTIGPAHDAEGNRSEISGEEAVDFLSTFWPASFNEMTMPIDAAAEHFDAD